MAGPESYSQPKRSEINSLNPRIVEHVIERRTRDNSKWSKRAKLYLEARTSALVEVVAMLYENDWKSIDLDTIIPELEQTATESGYIIDHRARQEATENSAKSLFSQTTIDLRNMNINEPTTAQVVFLQSLKENQKEQEGKDQPKIYKPIDPLRGISSDFQRTRGRNLSETPFDRSLTLKD